MSRPSLQCIVCELELLLLLQVRESVQLEHIHVASESGQIGRPMHYALPMRQTRHTYQAILVDWQPDPLNHFICHMTREWRHIDSHQITTGPPYTVQRRRVVSARQPGKFEG